MTRDQRHVLVRRKIERADKHILELKIAIGLFFGTKPYKIATKRNPDTRQLIYYLESVADTPFVFAAIAGDILNNLRSALDHLAQQLYLVGTGGISGFRDKTSFPIARSAKDFESGLIRKIEGMRQDAVDAIRTLQPYKGGDGEDLWTFHRLNNIDKHRLILTVGARYRSMNLAGISAQLYASARPNVTIDVVQRIAALDDLWINVGGTDFPLKAGDELLADLPDAEPNQYAQFRFEVVIHEPGVIEGQPLLETLVGFRDRVSNIIDDFKALLG